MSVSLTRKVSPLQDAVFGLASMGIKPWLELSYGNSHYIDGGKNGPGAAVPNSSVALQAFADWATAVAERYANVTDAGDGVRPVGDTSWEAPDGFLTRRELVAALHPRE